MAANPPPPRYSFSIRCEASLQAGSAKQKENNPQCVGAECCGGIYRGALTPGHCKGPQGSREEVLEGGKERQSTSCYCSAAKTLS